MPVAEAALRLAAIGRRFRQGDAWLDVLRGADLELAAGQAIALVGPSGSGKSTLLRCINGLTEFDEGSVRIDCVDIYDEAFGRNGLYRKVGIVFQAYNLFPHMNVLQNVTLAPIKVHGRPKAEAEEAAMKLLELFGLGQFAQEVRAEAGRVHRAVHRSSSRPARHPRTQPSSFTRTRYARTRRPPMLTPRRAARARWSAARAAPCGP